MRKEINLKKILRHILNKKQVRRRVLKADLLFFSFDCCQSRFRCVCVWFFYSRGEAPPTEPRLSAGSSKKETIDPETDLRAHACAQRRAATDSRLMEIVRGIIVCSRAGVVRHGSFRGKERSQTAFNPDCWGCCGVHQYYQNVRRPCDGCYWSLSLFTFRDVLG